MSRKKCDCFAGEKTRCIECASIFILVRPKLIKLLKRLEDLHLIGGCQPFSDDCVMCKIKKELPTTPSNPSSGEV